MKRRLMAFVVASAMAVGLAGWYFWLFGGGYGFSGNHTDSYDGGPGLR